MNPLTQTINQTKMNERELEMGISGTKNSWHQEYKDSAWIFLGGLPYEMTEGDVSCMFSQYGEVVVKTLFVLIIKSPILSRFTLILSETTQQERAKALDFSVTWIKEALY